jgi:hypothetical protein
MASQKKVPYYTKLDPELRAAMARYKAAVGVPEAVQIERALRAWLTERPDVMSVIATKYRVQLDAMTDLHEAVVRVLGTSSGMISRPGINQLVATTMMVLLTKACKTFRSIQTLCERGLHEDANALVRVLLETTVAIVFILQEKSKERAAIFHAYGWVQQIKMLNHWRRIPSLKARATDETLKQARSALEFYTKQLPAGTDVTHHWSGEKGLEAALKILGDDVTYATSFRFSSSIIHVTDFGAHFEAQGDSSDIAWQIEPRLRGFEAPTYAARQLLWRAATRIDERLGLGFREKLAPFKLSDADVQEGKK